MNQVGICFACGKTVDISQRCDYCWRCKNCQHRPDCVLKNPLTEDDDPGDDPDERPAA